MTPACWNIAGLILSLIGIVILFVFGMPFRVRTGGATFYVAETEDENEKKREATFDKLGWLGLALVVAGTILQIIGAAHS
jgi:hypothetical protein